MLLTNAAERAGLTKDAAQNLLNSDMLADEVGREADANRREGVNGVPHFTINQVYTVGGAQEPVAFYDAFRETKKTRERPCRSSVILANEWPGAPESLREHSSVRIGMRMIH